MSADIGPRPSTLMVLPDALVHELYGLQEEEIRIVEGGEK